mgnify:CR=1 FL=1
MSDAKDKTIALNVRLKPSESSAHPRATNYTNVGVAQGIAYVDFGFIEPTLLAAIAKTAKDGQAAPKGLEGTLVTRVAMSVDVLARLHQQIQQVLVSMRDAQKKKVSATILTVKYAEAPLRTQRHACHNGRTRDPGFPILCPSLAMRA